MKKTIILSALCILVLPALKAALPQTELYNAQQCEGSLTPYPTEIASFEYPDTLTPRYISHVGRHGSRYPASATYTKKLSEALEKAASTGSITKLGKELLALTNKIAQISQNRWGALDSLGMAEQRAIATRMVKTNPEVFTHGAKINALSSYSPRSMMSMYSFVHQMDRLDNTLEFTTTTGRQNSYLMRPFDVDDEYTEFIKSNAWKPAYDEYFEEVCPTSAIKRVLGADYPFNDKHEEQDLAITEYYVIAGLQAMELPSEMSKYFTAEEMNALWSCFNLRQYLQRSSSTVSTTPADIAAALVLDIITRADQAIEGVNPVVADLRFGHAETIFPLVALLRLPGCYYLTNYFDTVNRNWKDFFVSPMATNIQFVLLQHKTNDRWYVCVKHNEKAVSLIPGNNNIFIPWGEARRYMMNCVPLFAQ
ncbi:MAG: hypothetical protein J1F20_05245 [Muribaculaceae bacterium]|nr:hypothetical protein [Muribaculaceae bacterium]